MRIISGKKTVSRKPKPAHQPARLIHFVCPRHPDTKLRPVLAGGVGFCGVCWQYVQGVAVRKESCEPD